MTSVLFTLHTPRFRLTWRGPEAGRSVPDGLVVSASGERLELDVPGQVVHRVDTRWTGAVGLLEETTYTVFAESLSGDAIALRCRDPLWTRRLSADAQGRVLHGTIRVGATAGTSRFEVRVGGRTVASVAVQVAPRKVSGADVDAMQADLHEALSGLATVYLGGAARRVQSRPSGSPSRPFWLARLQAAMPRLDRALEAIARRPRQGLERPLEHARPDRLRRAAPETVRALLKGSGICRDRDAGAWRTAWLPARPAQATSDTSEHRWIRFQLEAVLARLAAIRSEEAALQPGPRRGAVLEELLRMEHVLRTWTQRPPFAEADPGRRPPRMPIALRIVPAYAEAAEVLRYLQLGLALAEGDALASSRNLAELYELWCYLTVARLLAEALGQPVPARPFFAATARGVALRLHRGRRHALRFRQGARTVRLVYQPRFGGAPSLLVQRPDLLIEIEQPGRSTRRVVLDAKYRRDDSPAYAKRYGTAGPPEEALGDLHRYRDAIVSTTESDSVARPIEAALALYPYRPAHEDAFRTTRLWTSIGRIGVGALPLLPGSTGLLWDQLGRILDLHTMAP